MPVDKFLEIYDEQGNPVDYDIRANDVKFQDGKDLPTVLDEMEQEIQDAGGYEPPAGGIPKTDLAQGVQGSLDAADTAYQKPASGIPSTDMTQAVQDALAEAASAVQPGDSIPASDVSGLASVATSGDYDDLQNKPTIPDVSNLATKNEVNTGLAGKADKSDTYTKSQTDAAIQTEVQDAVGDVTVNAISNLPGTMGIAYAGGITIFAFGFQEMSAPPVITTSETASQVVVTATGSGTIKLYDNGSEVASGTGSASYTFTKGFTSSTHTMTATAKETNKNESMPASLEVTVPAKVYIADGLIFQLDGEDATNSTWVDKIGNKSFALTDCTKNADGSVSFNGSSSRGLCSESPVVGDDWTIEIVYNNENGSGNQFLLSWQNFRATNYGITYAFWNTGGVIINALYNLASGADRNFDSAAVDFTPGLKVHSITSGSLRNIQSGVAKSFDQVIGFRHESTTMQMQIGARWYASIVPQSGDSFFNGKIYQVRVYNRALTAEEINWNQAIDMNKYNIS